MFPDYRSIMRARLGIAKPVADISMQGPEGRVPYQPPTGIYDQNPKPEPWVPQPMPGPISDYSMPEGRVPQPRYGIKNPWMRF